MDQSQRTDDDNANNLDKFDLEFNEKHNQNSHLPATRS